MSRLYLIAALVLILVLLFTGFVLAQQGEKVGGRIIVCMIQLEHADAEYLATVLKPFLSPEGRIVSYKRQHPDHQGQGVCGQHAGRNYQGQALHPDR